MAGRSRLLGRVAMLAVGAVIVVVLAYAGLVPPCPLAAVFFVPGILLLMGPLLLLAFLDKVCRVRVGLGDGSVVVRLGACGRIEIPVGSIAAVRLVERVKPVLRLAGTAVPGVYYSGYYLVEGNVKAYIFSERLDRLVELRLRDGRLVYLGGDAPEKLATMTGEGGGAGGESGGEGGGGGFHVAVHDGLQLLLALAALVYVVAGLLLYPYVPERIPTHFGAGWKPDSWGSRWEALAMYYGVGSIGIVLAAFYKPMARRDPVAATLTVPVVLGLFLMGLGMLLIYVGPCTWWMKYAPPS